MKCAVVKIGDVTAIVCGRGPAKKKCVVCKATGATRLCDWKVGKKNTSAGESGIARGVATCDVPLCNSCSFNPVPDKDLCPEHKKAFREWEAAKKSEKK